MQLSGLACLKGNSNLQVAEIASNTRHGGHRQKQQLKQEPIPGHEKCLFMDHLSKLRSSSYKPRYLHLVAFRLLF